MANRKMRSSDMEERIMEEPKEEWGKGDFDQLRLCHYTKDLPCT